MSGARTAKEATYDDHISPLMTKIISLCKEHKINMIADFSLGFDESCDQNLYCTTCLHNVDPEDENGMDRMRRAKAELVKRPFFAAFTISTGGDS